MLKVLVADDDRCVRHLLRNILSDAGRPVFFACNGQETCDIANEHDIDIAIMDMNVPHVDGCTATRQMNDKIDQGISVIAVIAYRLPGDQARADATGCTRFLSKPIDLNVLTKTLSEVLEERSKDGFV